MTEQQYRESIKKMIAEIHHLNILKRIHKLTKYLYIHEADN